MTYDSKGKEKLTANKGTQEEERGMCNSRRYSYRSIVRFYIGQGWK